MEHFVAVVLVEDCTKTNGDWHEEPNKDADEDVREDCIRTEASDEETENNYDLHQDYSVELVLLHLDDSAIALGAVSKEQVSEAVEVIHDDVACCIEV